MGLAAHYLKDRGRRGSGQRTAGKLPTALQVRSALDHPFTRLKFESTLIRRFQIKIRRWPNQTTGY